MPRVGPTKNTWTRANIELLGKQRDSGLTYREIGAKWGGVSKAWAHQLYKKRERLKNREPLPPASSLEIAVRFRRVICKELPEGSFIRPGRLCREQAIAKLFAEIPQPSDLGLHLKECPECGRLEVWTVFRSSQGVVISPQWCRACETGLRPEVLRQICESICLSPIVPP